MKKYSGISILYSVGAAYDGILGFVFLVMPLTIFAWFGVTPPNHVGYVQFPGALLLIFALMFINIARNPVRNRNLIPYGILLKVAYSTLVFWHWFTTGIPGMWKAFAVFDVCFGVLFAWSYIVLAGEVRGH